VQNVSNSNACAQQVESSVVIHQADHDNAPFGHTQQQTTKMITQIYLLERTPQPQACAKLLDSEEDVSCNKAASAKLNALQRRQLKLN
jgi:hypothetical protein